MELTSTCRHRSGRPQQGRFPRSPRISAQLLHPPEPLVSARTRSADRPILFDRLSVGGTATYRRQVVLGDDVQAAPKMVLGGCPTNRGGHHAHCHQRIVPGLGALASARGAQIVRSERVTERRQEDGRAGVSKCPGRPVPTALVLRVQPVEGVSAITSKGPDGALSRGESTFDVTGCDGGCLGGGPVQLSIPGRFLEER